MSIPWGGIQPADRLAAIEQMEKIRDDERFKEANEKKAIDEKEKKEHDRTLATKVIFQSDVNNLYLHFDGKSPDIPNLRYAGDYSFGLDTRHEVVRQAGDTGLIHILCLRNNKYWSYLERDGNKWITAVADKPTEKESDNQCTLFRPVYGFSDKKRVIRLQHVNTGHYVRLFQGSGHYDGCLYLYPKLEDVETFTFIDWEKVVVLPDLFRIKGDNGKHLKAGRDGYMGFNHQADDQPPVFDFEASPSRDGGVRLKSIYYDKYWTDEDYWVLLKEASTTTHETNTVFLPRILDGNQIEIRSLKSGKFCKRLTARGKENCLATEIPPRCRERTMVIDEPVISRKISNVEYDFGHARRYNKADVALIPDHVINDSDIPVTSELKLTSTVTDTTNWSNNHTVKAGIEATITAKLPVVNETGFSMKASSEYTFNWNKGGGKEEKLEVGTVQTIPVPPRTRVNGTLMATRLSYDIPFSYTQYDVLKDGTPKVYEKIDGIFTGNSGYGYTIVFESIPLK